MSFCTQSEWLQAIHCEGPMSQLTAHIHNGVQGGVCGKGAGGREGGKVGVRRGGSLED